MAELLRLLRKFKFIFVLLLFVIGFINNVNLDYNVVKLEGIGFWLNGFILLLGIVIILNMVISYVKKSYANILLKSLQFLIIVPASIIVFIIFSQKSILSFGESITIAGINQIHSEYCIIKNKHIYTNHGKQYEFQVHLIKINETIKIPTNESLFNYTNTGDSLMIKYYTNPNGSICIKYEDVRKQ